MENSVQDSALPDDYQGDSKVERVVNFAKAYADFGTDELERPFALLVEAGENPYAYPLRGKAFTDWLQYEAYQRGDVLKQEDLSEVLSLLTAHARFEGMELNVHLRSAKREDGSVELDCADDEGTRIRLEDGEVKVLSAGSDTIFHQSRTTQPLPMLAEEGDWRALLPFLNMEEQRALLLVGWLSYMLSHPKASSVGYPILVIRGEQGSGKSMLCKSVVRALVDPNASGIQIFPKDPKDLVIGSQNAFVLIFDNLRQLSKELSDVLCMAATEGTLVTRKLYTDAEDHVMHLHAPIVLNGIHDFVVEADLASRCLTIELLPMAPEKREHETLLKYRLEEQLPVVFRGLLELSAKALQVVEQVEVKHPERMLGFVRWLAALETVMDLKAGELQKAYSDSLQQAMLDTILENPFAYAVLEMAKEYSDKPWKGRPKELLIQLDTRVTRRIRHNSQVWPQNPIALSKRLGVLQKSLAAQGVVLQLGQRGKHRQIVLGYEATGTG